MDGEHVKSVRLVNVPSFLYKTDLAVDIPGLGELVVDVAYGGNFYAIVGPQKNYSDLADIQPSDVLRWSPLVRRELNRKYSFAHPENPDINICSHVLWTGKPTKSEAHARKRGPSTGTRPLTVHPAAPGLPPAWHSSRDWEN